MGDNAHIVSLPIMIYVVKQVKIRKILVALDTSHTLLIHRFIKFFMNLPGSASPKKKGVQTKKLTFMATMVFEYLEYYFISNQ